MSGPVAMVAQGLPTAPGVCILKGESSGLLALEKPCGVRSHPNCEGVDRGALLQVPYNPKEECYQWTGPDGGTSRFYLINRLDAPSSGILLGAVSAEISTRIKALFAQRMVKKRYYALVRGRIAKGEVLWRDRLLEERRGGRIRVRADGNSGAIAETFVGKAQAGRGKSPCSLLELEPKTGRTHQLRVQCAVRHLPIAGDATYGDFRFNRKFAKETGCKRLFLHSAQIAFQYEWQGKKVFFEAKSELPEEFMELLNFQPKL